MKIDLFYVDCAPILHRYGYAKVLRRLQRKLQRYELVVAECLKPLPGVSKDLPCQIAKCIFRTEGCSYFSSVNQQTAQAKTGWMGHNIKMTLFVEKISNGNVKKPDPGFHFSHSGWKCAPVPGFNTDGHTRDWEKSIAARVQVYSVY